MNAADGLSLTQQQPPKDVTLKSGSILNARGQQLFHQIWQAKEGEPKAIVVVQHGYSEHINRYHHVASYLARRGFLVFAQDAVGHGKSEGKRGHVARWDHYVDDLDLAVAHIKEGHKSLPVCLLGHSNGGLMTLRHALVRPGRVDVYAVSSPFCAVGFPVPAFKQIGAKVLSKLTPRLTIPSGIAPEKTSHVKEVVEAYKADPLVFTTTTARWAAESFAAQHDLLKRADQITHPFLFLVSADDEITDPKVSENVYHQLGSAKREFHLLPGMYHESLNEEGWYERLDWVVEWFERVLEIEKS